MSQGTVKPEGHDLRLSVSIFLSPSSDSGFWVIVEVFPREKPLKQPEGACPREGACTQ